MRSNSATGTDEAITSKRQVHRANEAHFALLVIVMAAMLFAVQPFGVPGSAHAQTPGETRKVIFVGGIAGSSECTKTAEYVDFWQDIRDTAKTALSDVNINLSDSDFVGFSYSGDYCPDIVSSFGVVPSYTPQDTCFGVDHAVNWLHLEILRLLRENPGTKFDLVGHSMGGVVISRWVALSDADSDEIRAIHSVTTVDSPLQGVDGVRSAFGNLYYFAQGCTINDSLTDLARTSSTIAAVRSPENTTRKVHYTTIRNTEDVIVPSDDAVLVGSWKDVTVTCAGLDDLGDHTCPVHNTTAREAISFAVSHDVIDEGPASDLDQSSDWSTFELNTLVGTAGLQSNSPGDSISAEFVGPSLIVGYVAPPTLTGLTTQPAIAEVDIDSGTRVETIQAAPFCLDTSGSIVRCMLTIDGLGDGKHSVTLRIKSAGDKGGFVFDYFEAETEHSTEPITCPPVANVDVVLIIDSSGSMMRNDPSNQRLTAAEAFVNNAANGDAIAVVDFDAASRLAQPITTIGADRSTFIQAINSIDSDGGTNIGQGLRAGYDALNASTTSNTKAAVLLTDGINEDGVYQDEHSLFSSKGWPVYVLGLGADVDPDFLNVIASGTGTGQYVPLNDANQLTSVYFDIARQQKCGIDQINQTNHLAQGETQTATVDIPAGQLSASFLVSWPGSVVDLTLVDPAGVSIGPDTTDANVSHAKGLTYELYRVENPAPGPWIMQIYGRDLAAGGEDVTIQSASIPNPSVETPAPQLPAPSPASSDGFDYALAAAATAVVGVLVLGGGGLWVFNANQGPLGLLTLSSPSAAATPFSIGRRTRSVTIGRSRSSDIFVDDQYASRDHARVYRAGDSLVIEDLKSTGGTTLNGERIQAAPLNDGDVIGIGESRLIFRKGRGRPRK